MYQNVCGNKTKTNNNYGNLTGIISHWRILCVPFRRAFSSRRSQTNTWNCCVGR